MMGKLYVVGTPIGNLGDISQRALDTLESVDFICAEDTRVTGKLLGHFGIKKSLVSYHEHNAAKAGKQIIERILAGEDAAITTDAGMPCISDPGEELVKLCAEYGVETVVIPGPTAMASALAVSALSTKRFQFEGFLPVDKKERAQRLAEVKNSTSTLIFYEAPHKLRRSLEDLFNYLGDRRISLCRELTKIHEETVRTTLSKAVEMYSENEPKGEFVLVIEGAETAAESETIEQACEQVRVLIDKGMRTADACKQIAKVTGFSKAELYAEFIDKNTP